MIGEQLFEPSRDKAAVHARIVDVRGESASNSGRDEYHRCLYKELTESGGQPAVILAGSGLRVNVQRCPPGRDFPQRLGRRHPMTHLGGTSKLTAQLHNCPLTTKIARPCP